MERNRERKSGEREISLSSSSPSSSSSSSSSASTPSLASSSSSDSLIASLPKSKTLSSSSSSSESSAPNERNVVQNLVSAAASSSAISPPLQPQFPTQSVSQSLSMNAPPSPPVDMSATATPAPGSSISSAAPASPSPCKLSDCAMSSPSGSLQICAPPLMPNGEIQQSLETAAAQIWHDKNKTLDECRILGFKDNNHVETPLIHDSANVDESQDDEVQQFLQDHGISDEKPGSIITAEKSDAPFDIEENDAQTDNQTPVADIQAAISSPGDSTDNIESLKQKKDFRKQYDENGSSYLNVDGLNHRNQNDGDATVQIDIQNALGSSMVAASSLCYTYGLSTDDGVAVCTQDGELHRDDSKLHKGTETTSDIDMNEKFANDEGGYMLGGKGSDASVLVLDEEKLQATSSAPAKVLLNQLAFIQTPVNHNNHSSALHQHEYANRKGSSIEHPSSERALGRSTTLPSNSLSVVDGKDSTVKLPRSNTEKGKSRKNLDSSNVRLIAAQKLSHRKKKKLMKNLGIVQKDGTVEFNLDESAQLVPDLFGLETMESFDHLCEEEGRDKSVPPLQIVILIVGTRGDVQPFIAIGKHLQEYGHRVRLATHANFREFVMSSGLEFYPLGGDPKVLAGLMVKNKGFLPSGPSEISIQRKQLKSIINSLLSACIGADTESGVPFRAQAIIANPPAYGHVHVHEALGVPLHIFFTMPWTPTSEFPHPFARIRNPAGFRISYQVVDSIIWLGIKSLINDFRKKKLKLRPITYLSGAQGSISHLPFGYIWSPHLVPKPKDWGPLTDVVGFCFLNLSSDYKPPVELVNWLNSGKAPIYIGFGSLPVEDPSRVMDTIIKALQKTEQRGIIVKGWGLTGDVRDPPDFVYLLENCPHDWLFPRCAAVVHHGGAGTTAAGLKAACPTTIVPFFGDQPFWGERVHLRGVGPPPIPIEHLSLDKLVAAIEFMLDPQVKERAIELAKCMEGEDGVKGAVEAFHRHLPKHLPECSPLRTTSRQTRLSDMMRKMVWC